jgi:hypothetical protein
MGSRLEDMYNNGARPHQDGIWGRYFWIWAFRACAPAFVIPSSARLSPFNSTLCGNLLGNLNVFVQRALLIE